ncbi:hypothetical protein CLV62_10327 [Dysgonomonas alginatilytica]|uniref:Leucine rich repeat (LRR) protein n=1 Tax=Dysgonomonas alginatilytica TaxID=1605892 RepID=A0A2V3PUH7_9BACT|nr:hypothetical protein [Dysgonomonas alginatilytica]PXV67354.1 hypothetical protein CLV62_10327 [Dysgonomonas alginatilytica]
MKTRLFTFILLATMMMCFSSCTSDDPLSDDEGTGGGNNLKTGQIQMKTTPNTNKFVYFTLNAKKVTIDWGDGQVDELTPNNVSKEFRHEYTNQNLQEISLSTEGMTEYNYKSNGGGQLAELKLGNCPDLELFSTYQQSQLTVLEFGNCPQLRSLSTYNCLKLSHLNLKGCLSLKMIDCYNNNLSELELGVCSSLEKLILTSNQLTSLELKNCQSLKNIECYGNDLSELELNKLFNSLPKVNGWINCLENPGWKICDKSIAEKKGWTVYN